MPRNIGFLIGCGQGKMLMLRNYDAPRSALLSMGYHEIARWQRIHVLARDALGAIFRKIDIYEEEILIS